MLVLLSAVALCQGNELLAKSDAFASSGSNFASGSSRGGVFDVTAFGAKGDGVTRDTVAVRAATEALRNAGGGELLFPGNKSYLTGAFNISSNTFVHIAEGATVLGSTRGEDWPVLIAAEVWPQFGHGSDCKPGTAECRKMHQALLLGWDVQNVTVAGGGVFDCNSQKDTWWKCADNLSLPPCSGAGRPHCMMFSNATDVSVNNLNVSNSPDWTLHFSSVTNLHVHHLNVHNPLEPNADGIDIDSSKNVLVEDCYFSVGDDALCVKSGIDYFGRLYNRSARDIVFRNNVIGTGHGITIGSETSGGVHNVTFDNIVMAQTGTGIRMKSQRGRGGVVSDVTYRNIDMRSIEGQCVQITLNYHPGLAPTNKTATPVFRNIHLANVSCLKARSSYMIDGLPEQLVENLTLANVTMSRTGVGAEAKCDNAQCACDAATSPCPSCCTPAGGHPTPAPPPPPPARKCAVSAVVGCYDDSTDEKVKALLLHARTELHDHVSLENCAAVCFSASSVSAVVAGIDGGNHCYCGSYATLTGSQALALKRPMAECQIADCPMTYKSQCACTGATQEKCGAPGRLQAYNFTCSS